MKYVCELCGWIYDEELGNPKKGIAPGTKFEDIPADHECPSCGCGKEAFDPVLPRTEKPKFRLQSR